MNLVCWNCGAGLDDVPRPISRHATCSQCFNELHCCRLCRHFDPKRSMQCFEDRADPPLQKENANFCDFFAPRADAFETRTGDKSEGARAELDALFGAQEPDEDSASVNEDAASSDTATPPASDDDLSPEELARKKLDDLFG